MFILVSFISTVKVVKFNRRRPLPDVQNEDFVSQNYGDAPGSLSITGYRSVLRHPSSLWIIVITALYFLCSCLCACFFKSAMFCGLERLSKMLLRGPLTPPPHPREIFCFVLVFPGVFARIPWPAHPPRGTQCRLFFCRSFFPHSVTHPPPERYSASPLSLPDFRSPFISVNNNCHSGNNYVAWKPETDTIALPFGR